MSAVYRMPILATCFLLSITQAISAQKNIEFDVPAIVHATSVSEPMSSSFKTIEISLPISSATDSKHRSNIDEFRFDVSWNRSVYSIADFSPKTETVSDIEGLINVEKDSTRNAGLNLNLSGKPFELASASIGTDIGFGDTKRERFQEVPQHDVLVSSGTINRGTGAFFRFHPSKRNTLEGSRNLTLTYRVPSDWQSGILKVECRASGSKSVAGLWNEPFEVGRSFVVPVYISENASAQKLAIDFAKAEQDLRKTWLDVKAAKRNPLPLPSFTCRRYVPNSWPHLLIQSGDDSYLSEFEGYLTQEVAVAAGKFVQARQSLDSME